MKNTRTEIVDIEAIAAMPGLEELAEEVAPFCRRADPVSQLILLAAQWAWRGHAQAAVALERDGRWEVARASAARVGRILPVRPPTLDEQRHLRDRAHDELVAGGVSMAARLAARFPSAQAGLVRSVGLLTDTAPRRLQRPERANVVYGDGTTFKPLSDVTVDLETGEYVNSRSRTMRGARVAERFYGKRRTDSGSPGLPIALLGVHGGRDWQRAVLGVELYFDRNEIGASMRLFDSVVDVFGDAVHGFIYDMLMAGTHMRHVMRRGVIPITDMREAAEDQQHLPVPAELRLALGRKGRPKQRASILELEEVHHWVGNRQCGHLLVALDGAIVAAGPGEHPSLTSPVVTQTGLWFEPDPARPGQQRLMARYQIPCRHGSIDHVMDLSGDRDARGHALADFVHPIAISAALPEVRGIRSDVESLNATLKGKLPHQRASSLRVHDFFADVIGGALWVNAIAWDVHAAHHTSAGARAYEMMRRADKRATRLGHGKPDWKT